MKVKTNLRAGKKSGTVVNTTSNSATETEVSSVETVSVPVSRCVGI